MDSFMRVRGLQIFVVAAFAIIVLKLFYIQVIDSSYKEKSSDNVIRREVLYPPRGEVFDRNGHYLVRSKEAYDLMIVPREVRQFDTMLLSRVVGVSLTKLRKEMKKAYGYSMRKPSVLLPQLPKEVKIRLDELGFPGFYMVYRTVRSYPQSVAGNLLGYVGEVNDRIIEKNPYYRRGDYIGMSGIEQAYEEELRGRKGVKLNLVDVHGISKGSYQDGIFDTLPVQGLSLTSSIDLRLQALGEELLEGKVGSIVAIEPSTGEILVMASSPTYDPDELVGRQRGNNYMKLLRNKRQPLFNRAVSSRYPPGSTFKLVNGLIGLQEGVLEPHYRYPCHNGYTIGRGVKCHSHWSPVDLREAVQTSCNAYFCYVLRNIMDNPKYGNIKNAFAVWEDYVRSFGFGRKLGSDFTGEGNGYVPSADFYNRSYNNRWNSLTIISLSIGQGELGCTPLQMANLAATIANRGYYYIPHVIKAVEGRDSLPERFYEKHYTKVEPKYFDPIVDGMYRAVHKEGGTARIANVAGMEACGKTGTAQNPHGKDHSTFLGFAPKDNPKIAVSVYVENGGSGATIAVPIASLIMEQYLNDTITRPQLVDYVKNMQIRYPHYDR